MSKELLYVLAAVAVLFFVKKGKGHPASPKKKKDDGKGLSVSDFDPTTDSKYGKDVKSLGGKALDWLAGSDDKSETGYRSTSTDLGGKGVLKPSDDNDESDAGGGGAFSSSDLYSF